MDVEAKRRGVGGESCEEEGAEAEADADTHGETPLARGRRKKAV